MRVSCRPDGVTNNNAACYLCVQTHAYNACNLTARCVVAHLMRLVCVATCDCIRSRWAWNALSCMPVHACVSCTNRRSSRSCSARSCSDGSSAAFVAVSAAGACCTLAVLRAAAESAAAPGCCRCSTLAGSACETYSVQQYRRTLRWMLSDAAPWPVRAASPSAVCPMVLAAAESDTMLHARGVLQLSFCDPCNAACQEPDGVPSTPSIFLPATCCR